MRPAFYFRFIALFLVGIIRPHDVRAQGDLQASPRRVTLDNEKTSQQISVMNTGPDTVVYLISVTNYKSKNFSNKKALDTLPTHASEPDIQVSTRKIMLAPMESQEIKISLLNASSITPGEYCAQIYLRAAGLRIVTGDEATKQHRSIQNQQLAMQVLPAIGTTIPIVIRIQSADNSEISAQ
jgi:hypothetical protein